MSMVKTTYGYGLQFLLVEPSIKTKMARSQDDNALVARAVAGDKEAYRQLVEKYQSRAFAIAYEITKSREDAEDVVQESFVKAFLSLKHFRAEASFYTWLYRIVYNMAIDYRRKIGRRGAESLSYDGTMSQEGEASSALRGSDTPHDFLFRKEQAKRIQEVLGQISDEHRTVLILRELEGMNYDQISKVVGISRGTVMSRLHYARKKLQKGLRDLVSHNEPDGGEVDPGNVALKASGKRQ